MKAKFAIIIGCFLLTFFACIATFAEENVLVVYPDPAYEYVFGAVEIGEAIVKDVVIMNKGNELLRGSAVVKIEETQTGEGEQEEVEEDKDVFQIVSEANFAIPPYEQFNLKIRFVPIKEKVYHAKLIIEAEDNNRAELTLVSYGRKKPKMYYLLGCGQKECQVSPLGKYYILDFIFALFTTIIIVFKSSVSKFNSLSK